MKKKKAKHTEMCFQVLSQLKEIAYLRYSPLLENLTIIISQICLQRYHLPPFPRWTGGRSCTK